MPPPPMIGAPAALAASPIAASAAGRISGPESSPDPAARAGPRRERSGINPYGEPLTESTSIPASSDSLAKRRSSLATGETLAISGRSVEPRAVSMRRSASSADDSHREPSRPSLGVVRSISNAAMPNSSARQPMIFYRCSILRMPSSRVGNPSRTCLCTAASCIFFSICLRCTRLGPC